MFWEAFLEGVSCVNTLQQSKVSDTGNSSGQRAFRFLSKINFKVEKNERLVREQLLIAVIR